MENETMATYNGHRNWNHWNVSLWLNNDEGLYRLAKDCIKRSRAWYGFDRNGQTPRERAARWFVEHLEALDIIRTPDGAPYTVTSVRAAMRGL
jgi:hypothetical protein